MCALRQPSPTVLNPNWGLCWLSCRLSVTKKWFYCQWNQQIQEDVSYCLGWLSVIVCALVHSRAPFSDPPMSCGTPCCPSNSRWLVAVMLQDNVGFHFEFFPTVALFFLGWWGVGWGWFWELGKVVAVDESCFSWLKCNCGRLRGTVWVFVGSSGSRGALSWTCDWTLRWYIARHH